MTLLMGVHSGCQWLMDRTSLAQLVTPGSSWGVLTGKYPV
jgi:hypothetical protein